MCGCVGVWVCGCVCVCVFVFEATPSMWYLHNKKQMEKVHVPFCLGRGSTLERHPFGFVSGLSSALSAEASLVGSELSQPQL